FLSHRLTQIKHGLEDKALEFNFPAARVWSIANSNPHPTCNLDRQLSATNQRLAAGAVPANTSSIRAQSVFHPWLQFHRSSHRRRLVRREDDLVTFHGVREAGERHFPSGIQRVEERLELG